MEVKMPTTRKQLTVAGKFWLSYIAGIAILVYWLWPKK